MTDKKLEDNIARLKKLTGTDTAKPIKALDHLLWIEDAFQMPELLVRPTKTSPWLTYRSKFTLLIGAEKLGKSVIACGDALEAIKMGMRVVYITVDEFIGDLIIRWHDYDDPSIKGEKLAVLNTDTDEISYDFLDAIIEQLKPDIIYMDSFTKIIPQMEEKEIPDDGDGNKWRMIIDKFTKLVRKHEFAMCFLIHTPGNNPRKAFGSIQIQAGADVLVYVEEKSARERKLIYKGRIPRDPVTLEWMKEDGGHMREVVGGKTIDDWLLNLLNSGTDYNREEIIAEGEQIGHSKKKIEETRRNLITAGKVEEAYPAGQGRRGKATYNLTDEGRNIVNAITVPSLLEILKSSKSLDDD